MNYTVKFRFTTVKQGPSLGCITGKIGEGECDITSFFPLEKLKTKTDELKSVAYESLLNNPKLKNKGSILSVDIIDVIQI